MGTPVSKQGNEENHKILVNKIKCEFGDTLMGAQNNGNTEYKGNIDTGVETTEMLCAADDDDVDEREWADIYQRLKTNRNDDLHILNTRFNVHDIPEVSDSYSQNLEPIFTSAVSERQTRINSANFNPHAVLCDEPEADEEPNEYENANMGFRDQTETDDLYTKEFDTSAISMSSSPNSTDGCLQEQINKKKTDRRVSVSEKRNYRSGSEQFLSVPLDERLMHSPAPKSLDNSLGEDCVDPFEGLDIPRQRVHSFGSSSIYSVKEISDDLYQKYRTEVKSCIRSYGFFEAFPSPAIVAEAQKIYRHLDIPSPVDEEGNILPHPPKFTKREYLAAPEEISFEDVREKLEDMPEALVQDDQLPDITNYLCKGLDNEMTKLKMLSSWVALKQLNHDRKDQSTSDNADYWCKLFRRMCKYSRIKTKLIKGVIRGPDYQPGNDVSTNQGIWLAVLVNYTWVLVDPVVRLGHENDTASSKTKENLFKVVEKLFQDPEVFVFTHYPDDEHWQLLARPITKDEQADMALVRPGFFEFHMAIVNYTKSRLVVKTPDVSISLSFAESCDPLKFKCQLQPCEKFIGLARARRYVFLETNIKDRVVTMRIRFPKKGSYILDLFGSTINDSWKGIISYIINYQCDIVSEPYPENPREEWGPGLDTINMQLTPVLFHSGEILMQKGILQLAFQDPRGLQFDHVLYKNDTNVSSESLKVSFLKDKNNDVVFIVDIDSKVTGIFTLQLLARANRQDNFFNFCNYIIRKDKSILIPKLEFQQKDSFEEARVTRVPESGNLVITVDASGLIQLTVDLKFLDKQELNLSEHARHWMVDSQGFIELNFPRKGKYMLRVLGRSVKKGQFRCIKEETLQVDIPSLKWSCFPKEGDNWNSWYKIKSPLSHHLEEKEDITFKVEIKHAQDVAVLGASGWFHLDRVEESWTWMGQVFTGPKSTRCRLLARFEVGSEKWSDLLWFKIMSEDDIERLDERQEHSRQLAYKERKEKLQNY